MAPLESHFFCPSANHTCNRRKLKLLLV
jgi:hypothetical protein